ncbi:MAG: nucleotidyltransferase family protein, partial [Lachnospirales bacterium]
SENFINILSAYLNNKEAEINCSDWDEIAELAAINNLGAIVYDYLKDKDICDNEKALLRLKKMFLGTVKLSVLQDIVTSQIISLFTENKIRHILFKGFIIKNYYPNKEFRTMGDIDIIIDECNREKVHNLLLNLGFCYDEGESKKTVRNYIKMGVCFEIHTKLVSKNLFDNIDYVKYFENCFDNCTNMSDYTLVLNNEYHLIYLIIHMAKHFKNGGCGVRMVFDIAVFINKLKDELNWNYVFGELDFLGLKKFSKLIFGICGKWFGVVSDFGGLELDLEQTSFIEEYILMGGTFGDANKNLDAIRIGANSDSLLKRIVNLMAIIFPSYSYMKERYVWFDNTPKWLLPLGWLRLWWKRVVTNRENSFKRIGSALKDNKDAVVHREIMDKIGL